MLPGLLVRGCIATIRNDCWILVAINGAFILLIQILSLKLMLNLGELWCRAYHTTCIFGRLEVFLVTLTFLLWRWSRVLLKARCHLVISLILVVDLRYIHLRVIANITLTLIVLQLCHLPILMNITNLLELSRSGTELMRLLHLSGILLKKITTFSSLLGLRGLVVALGEYVGQGAKVI